MGLRRELPHSYAEALKLAQELLSASHTLVQQGLIETEAEQIVVASVRLTVNPSFSRVDLYTSLKNRLPELAGDKTIVMAMARAEGKPLQYLTGYQQFLDHEYVVAPGVLIPRPETEFLVRIALTMLEDSPRENIVGFEIGIGSGAISIELLDKLPGLRIIATEMSPKARVIAEQNAARILKPSTRLEIRNALGARDVFEPFGDAKADFIVSNPPYLTATDSIAEDVRRHEPVEALFAPADDPLFFYRKIAREGPARLRNGGQVFLEVPHERAVEILGLFENNLWEGGQLLPDLTERERVLVAELRE